MDATGTCEWMNAVQAETYFPSYAALLVNRMVQWQLDGTRREDQAMFHLVYAAIYVMRKTLWHQETVNSGASCPTWPKRPSEEQEGEEVSIRDNTS